MSKIVYSHRLQTVLQQVVCDLGLTLTLSDAGSPVSLADNDRMLSDLAQMMALDLKKDTSGKVAIYTFRGRT